jgi:hypothetical protein
MRGAVKAGRHPRRVAGDAGSGGAEGSRSGSAGTVGKTEQTSGAQLSEKRGGGGRLGKA